MDPLCVIQQIYEFVRGLSPQLNVTLGFLGVDTLKVQSEVFEWISCTRVFRSWRLLGHLQKRFLCKQLVLLVLFDETLSLGFFAFFELALVLGTELLLLLLDLLQMLVDCGIVVYLFLHNLILDTLKFGEQPYLLLDSFLNQDIV